MEQMTSVNHIVPKQILLLTCEHAVNYIPALYKSDFEAYSDLLETHRGIDIGAQAIARHLQRFFQCELVEATVSRLLIDCNRSLTHPHCFSEITEPWPHAKKHQLITHYHLPFRENVIHRIQEYIQDGYQIWHLSIHSFTPILKNQIRQADIGFLYDPQRSREKNLAYYWQENLKKAEKTLRIRMNYPYLGKSNGFTTTLRKRFSPTDYLGLEVETNQEHLQNATSIEAIAQGLALSLKPCLEIGNQFI
ncbi:MAG: N-formylglutamate amidohydrolase [Legionella sp.]|nr:N-formylglutamate amidohydrolase [Legionella sp.]